MKRKKGFTLAEVLITLGIIGVVASITIPNLMTQIQDRQFKEAAKKAFSQSSQILLQIKQDNGGTLSGYYSASILEPLFISYFKVAKNCGLYGCVPYSDNSGSGSNPYNYKTLLGGQSYTWMFANQFVTTDGMFYGLVDNSAGRLAITVDVNGFGKGPNQFGRDVFMFELLNDVLVPMGKVGCWFYDPLTYCSRTNDHMFNGFDCMYFVMQGKDY